MKKSQIINYLKLITDELTDAHHLTDTDGTVDANHSVNTAQELVDELNVSWNHIKAHGALYNEMSKDLNLAMEYLEVIKEYQNVSIVYLPSGSTKIIDLFKSIESLT